jgi:dolichyl-phosphate beta-glucosyltransferase
MAENNIYLSVVIPAYNEERRIGNTLSAIRDFMDRQNYGYEVLVVDDGSTDATCDMVNATSQNWGNLHLITNPANQGKGAVVKQGIVNSKGKYILFTDADNATPIEQVDKLLAHASEYPIVIGSRYCKGGKIHVPQPWHRKLLGRASNLLIRLILVPGAWDTQCGFKLFERNAAQRIFSLVQLTRFGFDFESLAIGRHLGYKYKEVGIDWYNDPETKVKAGKEAIRTLRDLLKVKFNLIRGIYSKDSDTDLRDN